MKNPPKKYQHQHDLKGCGIACLSNLFSQDYINTKKEFEDKYYNIAEGVKVLDMVEFINSKGLNYDKKSFNPNEYNEKEALKYASILNSITLIRKNDKYPVGHYLLRIENGWVDSWVNYPCIDNVHAGVLEKLPGDPWYVVFPQIEK